MSANCGSQAAAYALRKLQEQLALAQAEICRLQDANTALRTDARSLAEAQHEQLKESEARNSQLAAEVGSVHSILQELRRALESSVQECTHAKAAACEAAGLRDQLASCREALAEANVRCSGAEGRALDAEGRCRALQGELGRAQASRASAEERAEGAASLSAQLKEQLGALRSQHAQRACELESQLQERGLQVEQLERELQTATRRKDVAEARARASSADADRLAALEGQLEEEKAARRGAESRLEQKQDALGELQNEVQELQQASADHARELAHARAAANAVQASLDMERGLTSTLNDALRRAEETLHKMVKLNHALKESVMRHHGLPLPAPPQRSSRQAETPATTCLPTLCPEAGEAPHAYQENAPSCSLCLGGRKASQCLQASVGQPHPLGSNPRPRAPHSAAGHVPQMTERMPCLRKGPAPSGGRPPLRPLPNGLSPGGAGHTKEGGREKALGSRALVVRQARGATTSGRCTPRTRDQLESVVLSLEDELAVLDLRYNDLLQAAAESDSDDEVDEMRRDALAQTTTRVLTAMQLKGQQIRQLRAHIARLSTVA
eukprot:jgi/Botrbrau1/11549/Bobra.60_1s0003.1